MDVLTRLWPGLYRDIVLNRVVASAVCPKPLRWRALRAYGMRVEPCNVSPGAWFGSARVAIGRHSFINYGCVFNTAAPVTIGARCDIAMQVLFVTGSHEIGGAERRAGAATSAAITVGNGCWIGARSVILPGVRIGPGTVIAAGAVVTANTDANSVYAGVPARKLRDLPAGPARTSTAPASTPAGTPAHAHSTPLPAPNSEVTR